MRRVTRRRTLSQLISYQVRGGRIQRNARDGQRWTNPLLTPWLAERWIAGNCENFCSPGLGYSTPRKRNEPYRCKIQAWSQPYYVMREGMSIKKKKSSAISICGGSLPFLTKWTGKLVPRYRFYSFLKRFNFRSSSGTGNKCLFCVDDFSSLVVLTMAWLFCGQDKTSLE